MIFICTLSRDSVNIRTTYDLVNMVKTTPNCIFSVACGTYINNLREGVAKGVSEMKEATHLLFIDSDMTFPVDTIKRLVAHDKDIIGANYHQRVDPSKWTAKVEGLSFSSDDKNGIEEVDTMGMGVCLIKTDVFRKLPQPYFNMAWNGKFYDGEDESFCNKAKLAGLGVWIDHDLSKEVKHVGEFEI